jgi:hypothetical protein
VLADIKMIASSNRLLQWYVQQERKQASPAAHLCPD